MTNRTISPLRQRMVEDMNARQLGPHSQRSHIYSCERFASFLKRSPDTAIADDVRRFQLHLMQSGAKPLQPLRSRLVKPVQPRAWSWCRGRRSRWGARTAGPIPPTARGPFA